MENNQSIKEWNKESIESVCAFVLASLGYFGLASLLDKIDYPSVNIFRFDTAIFNISGRNWWHASLDFSYWAPMIFGLIFLVVALFLGIKSIKKTSGGVEKGRMLGIVSVTLTTFVLAVIILLTFFPL
ncbi:MAG: hypothetical protein US18_C0023G0010 [Parcubacteria group bacterium GW2011_GWB1_36_5]|nr:MAG: hypothetical protein US12_C0005G0008 [Parcubacteria group bacterium GW2011_GWA2_36_24]KKQ07227.1 MAG: hypothetical protein US18_C0023G0010 [Parcubacteria group bacterium GW2011_GWB1_36_5]